MTKDNETKTITLKQSTGFNISLVILVMAIGAIITFTTFISDIKTRSIDNHNRIVEMEQDINKMQAETNESKVKYSEIQTQLKNIDATLIEIKQKLR